MKIGTRGVTCSFRKFRTKGIQIPHKVLDSHVKRFRQTQAETTTTFRRKLMGGDDVEEWGQIKSLYSALYLDAIPEVDRKVLQRVKRALTDFLKPKSKIFRNFQRQQCFV